MVYALIITYMILLPIVLIAFLWKILDTIEKNNKNEENKIEENKKNNKVIRQHNTIKQSNFENSFGGRKTYEIFKNTNGLYEPVTPSKGINLKKKEE